MAILLLALAGELLLAAQGLPHAHPTAPEAVDGLRSAPAHLLTDPARKTLGAAAGRFLGLSTITYDPGDMQDYRRIMLQEQPAQLAPRTFDDLVIAQKVQELLVPNLALLWGIPSIDGFDGGVLPLQRFNLLAQLLVGPEGFVPDGRLREQLREVPPAGLLNIMNVQYLITDKVRDLWFEDVYYDRQIGLQLDAAQPGAAIAVDEAAADFEATHLDLIAAAQAPADLWAALAQTALPVVEVSVQGRDRQMLALPITAGGAAGAQLADARLDSPAPPGGAVVAYQDVEGGRQEMRVRLALGEPRKLQGVTLRLLDNRFGVRVQAATLVDERTGMFAALLPSDRGAFRRVHSGDVKIYANLDLLPRAYVAGEVLTAEGPEEAAALLAGQLAAGGGALVTVVEGPALPGDAAQAQPGGAAQTVAPETVAAEIVRYGAEEVVVSAASERGGVLVLSDAYYPGWRAEVDGQPAPLYAANVLFRGVPLAAGEHTVVFRYEPSGWRLGLALGAAGLLLLLAAASLALWGFRSRRGHAV